jgi:hypothetical protein
MLSKMCVYFSEDYATPSNIWTTVVILRCDKSKRNLHVSQITRSVDDKDQKCKNLKIVYNVIHQNITVLAFVAARA